MQVVDDCEDYCLLDDKSSKTRKHPVLPSDIAVMPPTLLNLKNPVFHGIQLGEKKEQERSNKVKVKPPQNQANASKEDDLRFYFDTNKNGTGSG